MRRWWHKHRALVGYLVLLLVATGTVTWYSKHIQNDLERHDRISCEQRLVLAANQKDVIDTLLVHIRHPPIPATDRMIPQLMRDQAELKRAIEKGC